MNVLRVFGLIILGLLAVGFGLCAAASAVFSPGAPALLMLTAVTGALTWVCVLGMRSLFRGMKADDATGSKPPAAPAAPPAP